jgi:flavin reductase (DIM6/NTAB) family NADH-FMN oxidoreductase RutF
MVTPCSYATNEATLNHDAFGNIMASLDSPLVVVTAAIGRERAGCLVGFHTQSSMEPVRFSIWLSKANHTYRVALRATHLGVHFLTNKDMPLAERFGTLSGDTIDKFVGIPMAVAAGEAPIMRDWPNWLLAQRIALLDDGGDHICLAVEPVAAHSSGPFEPLRLSHATQLQPGHQNQERHNPPTERAGSTG